MISSFRKSRPIARCKPIRTLLVSPHTPGEIISCNEISYIALIPLPSLCLRYRIFGFGTFLDFFGGCVSSSSCHAFCVNVIEKTYKTLPMIKEIRGYDTYGAATSGVNPNSVFRTLVVRNTELGSPPLVTSEMRQWGIFSRRFLEFASDKVILRIIT